MTLQVRDLVRDRAKVKELWNPCSKPGSPKGSGAKLEWIGAKAERVGGKAERIGAAAAPEKANAAPPGGRPAPIHSGAAPSTELPAIGCDLSCFS
jgi:hypothetical protein